MVKIAINGFGRIGRPTFKILLEKPNLEVVAINDLTDTKTLAHLLKYDSVYGKYNKDVDYTENAIIIDGKKIKIFSEKNPENLLWKNLEIDIVLECTGYFTDYNGAKKHLDSRAKKVIISAPSSSEEIPTFVLGVNEKKYNLEKDDIISNSSCTTNCLAPVVKVLDDVFEIEKGFMTTIHSYTNDQRILDLPHKDLRRARAAGLSIIPTTTGSAKDIGKILPHLAGKLDAIAIRIPTPTVSVIDFTVIVKKSANVEDVNSAFKNASQKDLKNILDVSEDPLVSIDYRANTHSAIVDAPLTKAQNNLVKVTAWYDNEWGYACRLAEMTEFVGRQIE